MVILHAETVTRPTMAMAAYIRRFVMKMRKKKSIGTAGPSVVHGAAYDATGFTPREKGKIARSVNKKYFKVAKSPEGLFKYPTGRAGLEALKYDPELVRLLPDSVAESYCGPGNPFSIGTINNGESVLDIGCGAGVDTILAGMMAGPEGYSTGLEIVPEMLERAQSNLRELDVKNVTVIEASAEKLPLPDSSFDVVISNGVFNLIVDKANALKEVYRVLKPGGRFQVADQVRTGEMPKETSSIVKSWGR